MIDWGRRAGRCQGHQTVHRGSCHPKTPRDVLISKGDGWQNPSSDLSRPGIPGCCGAENPSWAGEWGTSPQGEVQRPWAPAPGNT